MLKNEISNLRELLLSIQGADTAQNYNQIEPNLIEETELLLDGSQFQKLMTYVQKRLKNVNVC